MEARGFLDRSGPMPAGIAQGVCCFPMAWLQALGPPTRAESSESNPAKLSVEHQPLIFWKKFPTIFAPFDATAAHPEMAAASVDPADRGAYARSPKPISIDSPARPSLGIERQQQRRSAARRALKRYPFRPLRRPNDNSPTFWQLLRRRHIKAKRYQEFRLLDQPEPGEQPCKRVTYHQPALPRKGWTSPAP